MYPERHGIEFRLLGAVEMTAGDRVLEVASAKQRALLASLLLRLNHVVPVESLVDDLWDGAPPASVRVTLQSLVSRLRRGLERAGPDASPDEPRLRSREGGYVLEAAPDRVDAVRFDRLVGAGRRALATGDAAAAADALEEALGLWRGAALGDLADRPFARGEAQRLEEARLGAVEDLADALLAVGRPQDALDRLERHLAEWPLRERPWRQLMLALYRLGRQADALRAFRRVRRVLAEELGVEPMPELRRLAERILHQDPDLTAPADPVPRRTGDIVVFLFIDVAAGAHLACLDAFLPEAVAARGGVVFGHPGAGVCTAFPTVSAAVAAAVAVHRGLRTTTEAPSLSPGVRMAVHAGAADRRAGSWSGPALGRTARLLAAAAGGQVVCSHVAAELGRDDLPADMTLVDLGEHRLTDLERPERVFQVAHPDLQAAVPLGTLEPRRHNLPVPLTSFVGRERELGEVVSLLAESRLLTLTGPGGSGKTRLALQAAPAVLDRFSDGVWLVELAPLRDPDRVAGEVATALGLLPGALARPDEPLERRLCDQLRARRLLLVLDNCEHVVEAAARLAEAVLTQCPDVAVLGTSREVLGVPGEVVWKVPSLSLPHDEGAGMADLAGSDAVALFCERARAARPGFALSDTNAAPVARICRRLDGIPLGLELAAGRIGVLSAQQVAERLDDRFRLLTGGGRTVVPRHQTLRAAMDWSYTLLHAPEQAVLRQLSVFRGTFPLDAAEAVVGEVRPDPTSGADLDVLGLLTRLVDKSMVSVVSDEPDVRYGLLETVREYAGEKLAEAGERDQARNRHRDHFLGLADTWAAASDYWNWWQWLRRLVAEHDDFAAALDWSHLQGDHDALLRLAAAHWPYWYWGETLGWRRWLVEAVEVCTTPSPARVEALIALASLLERSGEESTRCEALFAEARDVALALPGGQSLAQVEFYRAHVLLSGGRRREAEGLLRGALERSTNADFLGWCHWGLGWIALLEDDVDEARTEFGASLRSAEDVDDESLRAHVCSAFALLAGLQDDPDSAAAMAARAVRSAERLVGAPRVLMMSLARAGQAVVLSGDGCAASPVSRLLRMLRDMGVTYWADEALDVTGLILAGRHPEEAAAAFCAARPVAEGDGRLPAIRERLAGCRARLIETRGSRWWEDAAQRARAMPAEESIARALAALEADKSLSSHRQHAG